MQINSKAHDYVKEREKVQQWIRGKVDYRSDELRKPYTFVKDTSHYDCQLPTFQTLNPQLKDLYKRSSLDQDMIDDLESALVLNWCPSAMKLYAVATPRDGNCLVHSVSLAVWGVEDFTHVLRELLLITARNDFHHRFKKRWQRQHLHDLSSLVTSTLSASDQEWEDVIRSISNMGSTTMCAAVPHRFLESVHIYILANILRRPIIVLTDSLARSVTGQSLQENNIGGIYLPLEWDPAECCKTPVIIGYSLSHFCPLISELVDVNNRAREESMFLFPLVSKDLSFLPIRYLREEEERKAWELVQKFFNMKELEVDVDSIHTKIPCAKMVFKPFEKNLFYEHLKLCEQRLASVIQAENDINRQAKTRHAKGPYFQIQLSSQTEVVRIPLTSSSQGNVRVGQPVASCVTQGCLNVGDPNQGNMCDSCLRNFTIAEAGRELISLQDGSIRYYAVDVPCHDPDNTASAAATIGQIASSVIPTAPPPSFGYMSETEVPLSMLNDRCIKKCGYRCSTQTAPYCHQCFQLEQNKQRQREENLEPTAPVDSMIISEGNVLIESELNVQDEEITVLNSLSSSESSYLPSSISDILKQKDISDTEITWIEGGNIYSLKTPTTGVKATASAGVRPTATLGERSYSKLEELFCKRSGCEGVRLKEKDFCLRCSEELEHGGKLQSFVTPLTSEAKSSSAFPETTAYNNQQDIEISAEQSVRCAYPNCENQVTASNKLCNKCQDILIELSKTHLAVGGATRANVHEPATKQNESEKFETTSNQHTSKKEKSENFQFQAEMQPRVTPWVEPMEIGHKIDDIQREKERSMDEFSTAHPTLRQTFHKMDDIQREKDKQIIEDKSKSLKEKVTEIQREAERQIQQSSGAPKFKFEAETSSRRSSSLSPKSSVKNVSSSRGKHCRVSGCQNYGDPSEDNMCSTCYRKSLKHTFPLPRHPESRLHTNTLFQPITQLTQPVGHLTRPTMHPSSEVYQYGTSVHQSSSPSNQDYLSSFATSVAPYKNQDMETNEDKFEKFKSTFPEYESETRPTLRHDVVTSKSSFASQYGSQQQPSSGLRETDQRFNQVYEKTVRKGEQAKCKMHHCGNYGNPKKVGYCNACYNIYKQQQAIETYGEDVPDKLIN